VSWIDFFHRHCAPCAEGGPGPGQALRGGVSQRLESISRVPYNIVAMPCLILTLSDVNVTSHPLSHICPTDKIECWAKPGNKLARLAVIDKDGRSKVAVCVDAMTAPFGR
jgi:hypothetical protein